MPMESKIVQFSLAERTMALVQQGKTTRDIAEILTAEAAGRYVVSRSAVQRYLKPLREKFRTKAATIIEQFVEENLPGELDRLTQMSAFFWAIFTGTLTAEIGKDGATYTYELSTRWDAARMIHDLAKTLLKAAGAGQEDPRSANPFSGNIDENEVRELKEFAEALANKRVTDRADSRSQQATGS
jgi:hypothetical protein